MSEHTDYTNSFRNKNRSGVPQREESVAVGGSGGSSLPDVRQPNILENAAMNAGSQILVNVLVPTIQDLIRQLFEKWSKSLFKKDAPDSVPVESKKSTGATVKPSRSNERRTIAERMQDVPARSKEEVIKILNDMYAETKDKGYVTVGYFFTAANCQSVFTDENWGWPTTKGMDAKLVDPVNNLWNFVLPKWRQLE